MITLKKSFELQNYLRSIFNNGLDFLSSRNNVTTVTHTHMRSKAYAEAQDETIVQPKNRQLEYDVNTVIGFVGYVQKEMASLTAAICAAKHNPGKDFDAMIANNSTKRNLLVVYEEMAAIKSNESTGQGNAKKFNAEGNQVSYTYDVKVVQTIDFDREKVKAMVSRLRKELDEVSTQIDAMQIETMVDFESIFEIGDNFDDALDRFVSAASKE